MEEQGFALTVEDVEDAAPIKQRYQVPPPLQSCHTAIVDGAERQYVVEGHVPADDVRRLLAVQPDVLGIAVPGMPIGSPGMEVAGTAPQPFDVLAFDGAGGTSVWASYPAE